MSEAVERRVLDLLGHPAESPYGNPIPGLEELGARPTADPFLGEGVVSLGDLEPGPSMSVVVRRIGEPIQTDPQLMYALRQAGVRPGAVVKVTSSPCGVLVGHSGKFAELPIRTAAHIFVAKR
ncbi:hypothetical protein GCM10027161_41490 [Microbispora hainanensis]